MLITILVFTIALAGALFYFHEKDEKKRKRILVSVGIFLGTMFIYFFLCNGRYHEISSYYYFDKWTGIVIEAKDIK